MISHLGQEVTTLATCWELKRRDGKFFRFTDNVTPLVIDGFRYRADVGYSRSAIASGSSLAVDSLEVVGAFDSETITEQDLRNGLFDGSEIRIFLVNYNSLADGVVRMRRGTLGEVQDLPFGQFVAELRGLSYKLQQTIGNLYQPGCRAQLGAPDICKFPIDPQVVLRDTYYSAGDFVKVATGNPTASVISIPVVDADFESLGGWTTESGVPAIVASQNGVGAYEGSNFLTAAGADFVIYQDIDLTLVAGFSESDNDAGFYQFQASVQRCTTSSSRSYGRVRVLAVDENGEVIKELWNTKYERVFPTQQWVRRQVDSAVMPAGARSLRVYVEAGSQAGTGSTAAFDDLRLEIVDNDGQTGAYAFFENKIYECTTTGVTASAQPVYDETVGNTTADGTAVFTARDSFSRHGVVSVVTDNANFRLTMTPSTPASVDDYYNGGAIYFETGANAGQVMEIRDWTHSTRAVKTFLALPEIIAVGDKVRIIPGCNRTREDCRDKFRIPSSLNLSNGNVKAYDGEPDLPGPDAILTYADAT